MTFGAASRRHRACTMQEERITNEEVAIVEELWQRVSRGRHTALLGRLPPEPPPGLSLRVVRVSCDVPHTALGPLLEASRKVEAILGDVESLHAGG